jgi:hypothetical protein
MQKDDRIPIAILEDFIKTVRSAAKLNQKELKLSMQTAESLSHALNLLVLRILEKQQNQPKTEEKITIEIDGGSL